ncbi:MAG: hypothetical protein V1801_00220 [Candidatus Falkowbacteria bacterium]
MPKGLSKVTLGPDWSVVGIIAIDNSEEVPFAVMSGEIEKLPTRHIISDSHFKLINRQVRAVVATAEKRANLARQLKKPNWSFNLQRYGVVIEKDGLLSISRWITKKDNTHERIWQTLPEIKSAIRQQDHIIEGYLEEKNGMENGREIPPEFSNLLKRLLVVQPYIEMRRELLIFAQTQMDLSIQRTIKGLELLLRAKGNGREKCHGLPEKLKRLAFFLNNSWPKPYRKKIDQILPLIKEAKKSAANLRWEKTKLLLSNAKKILILGNETSGRQSQLISISEIDPIKILAEIDKYNLTDEVIAIAKRVLSEPYYIKSRGLFRLNAMLAVSELVITGKVISQEEILKLCR